jgi:DNA-binding beta-propeller fold protein YncE
MRFNTIRAFAAGLLTAGLWALGAVTAPVAAQEANDGQSIFYPGPPNEPRLQFLKAFSSSLDVTTERKGFRDFVFGDMQNERKLLQKPYGLAVHDGAIYVTDTRGNGYGVFDLANGTARIVKPGGAGGLSKPINITIDEDGTRYVTDTTREQIMVYDQNDQFLRAIGARGQFKPSDVAIKEDRLYVADLLKQEIHVLDKATGEEVLRFGGVGSGEGQLLHPTNLALGPEDTLLVTDSGNFRLQEFTLEGEFIRTMGSAGNRPGTFARPKGLAADNDGNIYVVDSAFNNVQVLGEDGGALMAFGAAGAGPDSIDLPTTVIIDYDHLSYFQQYADPNFDVEYLVFVASQFGRNKVVVYGYGEYKD